METSPESFPAPFVQRKVLPVLLNALNMQPNPQSTTPVTLAGSKLLPLCLRLAKTMPDAEWKTSMTPALVKAFGSPDRGMRMALLETLDMYADRLDNKTVTDKIWGSLIAGLGDSVAAIREATLKAILPLAPKLSDRILNNDLLRILAKAQVDPEATIRTNTTILIGRLAPFLSNNTKRTVLVPAFARALKDSFVHARVAGMMALIATGDSFETDDLAKQVLPAIMPGLVDKEKVVRDQAHKACDVFLKKVKEVAATMPETMLPPDGSGFDASGALPSLRVNPGDGLASTAGNAASALAGWAMSSAMSQFSKQTSSAALQNTALDSRIGELRISTPPASSSPGSAAAAPPLPLTSPRPNGFRAHSSAFSTTSIASSSGSSSGALAPAGDGVGDEWESMDGAAPAAPSRPPGVPGMVGGLRMVSGSGAAGASRKKMALGATSGAARGKKSLADTILAESNGNGRSSSALAPRPSLAPANDDDDDLWGEDGAAAAETAPASASASMSNSAELTAAAFGSGPDTAWSQQDDSYASIPDYLRPDPPSAPAVSNTHIPEYLRPDPPRGSLPAHLQPDTNDFDEHQDEEDDPYAALPPHLRPDPPAPKPARSTSARPTAVQLPTKTHDDWDDATEEAEDAALPNASQSATASGMSPSPSSAGVGGGSGGGGAAAMTKEEKRAEMQRQREERKARMAALKAQRG